MDLPTHTTEVIETLSQDLQIPRSKYEAAERGYKALSAWLLRPESSLVRADPQVYVQGSFRLGTAIRPISDEDDYDVDIVCELNLSKRTVTQERLKARLGHEIKAYARARGMTPPEEGRRCWTLNYADGSQFHMDALPAVPDGAGQRLLLEQSGFSTAWAGTAIAITDKDRPNYQRIDPNWPHSNPKGYAEWFRTQMRRIFDLNRQILALSESVSVEEIPEYRVRTPLQSTVQILKRHRDIMFSDRSEEKPISIILTTLAGHAYNLETSTPAALYGILDRLDGYVEDRNGVAWIANPTDPSENFADRWKIDDCLEPAFREWLTQARLDFGLAALAPTKEAAEAALRPRLRQQRGRSTLTEHRSGSRLAIHKPHTFLAPSHKKEPRWQPSRTHSVTILRATVSRNGTHWKTIQSNEGMLPKHCDLQFEAQTDVTGTFRAYWQVVNTGTDAQEASCLRGGFDGGNPTPSIPPRTESTLYSGTHSIECFIVQYGYLVARSGQFIVNIE